jgi:hypothetical protein
LTGIATILNCLFGLPVGTVSLILNIPPELFTKYTRGSIKCLRSMIIIPYLLSHDQYLRKSFRMR